MGAGATHVSYAEYLRMTPPEGVRYEYRDGLVVELVGGARRHAVLIQQLGNALLRELGDGPCRAFHSGLRVRSSALNRTFYPDVLVACPPFEWAEDDPEALVNPVFVAEVLSPSTQNSDLGERFEPLRSLTSVREILYVPQSHGTVQLRRRESTTEDVERWQMLLQRRGVLRLESLGIDLDLDALYAAVDAITPPDPDGPDAPEDS